MKIKGFTENAACGISVPSAGARALFFVCISDTGDDWVLNTYTPFVGSLNGNSSNIEELKKVTIDEYKCKSGGFLYKGCKTRSNDMINVYGDGSTRGDLNRELIPQVVPKTGDNKLTINPFTFINSNNSGYPNNSNSFNYNSINNNGSDNNKTTRDDYYQSIKDSYSRYYQSNLPSYYFNNSSPGVGSNSY